MMRQVDELKQIAARLGSLRRSLQAMGNLEEFSEVGKLKHVCFAPLLYARRHLVSCDVLNDDRRGCLSEWSILAHNRQPTR